MHVIIIHVLKNRLQSVIYCFAEVIKCIWNILWQNKDQYNDAVEVIMKGHGLLFVVSTLVTTSLELLVQNLC